MTDAAYVDKAKIKSRNSGLFYPTAARLKQSPKAALIPMLFVTDVLPIFASLIHK